MQEIDTLGLMYPQIEQRSTEEVNSDLLSQTTPASPTRSYVYTPPPQYMFVRTLADRLSQYGDGLQLAQSWQHSVTSETGEIIPILPGQFEVHLPGDGETPCNLSCTICAGRNSTLELARWEPIFLQLLDNMHTKGYNVPHHIYGGQYTEPMSNPYFLRCIEKTKEVGSHVGIHTNGTFLRHLEHKENGISKLLLHPNTTNKDYISISVYGGSAESYTAFTGTTLEDGYFKEMVEGIKLLGALKQKYRSPLTIRLSYLGTAVNLKNPEEIEFIISLAREAKVNSMRVSIAFFPYNTDLEKVRNYSKFEKKLENQIWQWLPAYLVENPQDNEPSIFYRPVSLQRPELFDGIAKCRYGYFQITFGAKGWMSKCSTTTTLPTHTLGPISSNVHDLLKMVATNQDETFNAKTMCFDCGQRCNQMGLQINRHFDLGGNDPEIQLTHK